MTSSDRNPRRRQFIKGAGVSGAALLAGCSGTGDNGGTTTDSGGSDQTETTTTTAEGVDFPTQDVSIVIPYAPGGGFDSYCRLMANELNQLWDVGVRATNISGGGGRIATEQVYNAKPDGHTFMLLDGDAAPVEQVREDVNYDLREFTVLGAPLKSVNTTAVGRNTGITSAQGYFDAISNGNLINCSPGATDPGVLGPYLLGQKTGEFDPQKVLDNSLITQSSSECVTATERGDVGATTVSTSSMMRSSYLSVYEPIIHYSFEEENPFPEKAPHLQTMAMLGYSKDQVGTVVNLLSGTWPWVAPPGVPDDVANVLRDSIAEVQQSESWANALEQAELKNTPVGAEEAERILEGSLSAFKENRDLIERLG